jgi:hypothetical protein
LHPRARDVREPVDLNDQIVGSPNHFAGLIEHDKVWSGDERSLMGSLGRRQTENHKKQNRNEDCRER